MREDRQTDGPTETDFSIPCTEWRLQKFVLGYTTAGTSTLDTMP